MSYINVPAAVEEQARTEAKARGAELGYAAGADDLAELSTIAAAAPDQRALIERFGDEYYDPDTDTLTIKPQTKRDVADFMDAVAPQLKLQNERSGNVNAKVATGDVEVRRKDGVMVRVAAGNEHAVCLANGCKPVTRYTQVREVRRGPGGLLWRKVSEVQWENTGRCSLTRPWFPCESQDCEWCGPGNDLKVGLAKLLSDGYEADVAAGAGAVD